MAKYSKYEKKEVVAPHKIHPAWRGIGFLMIILVPIISWGMAELLVPVLKASEVPRIKAFIYSLDGRVKFDAGLYQIPVIGGMFRGISSIDDLMAKVVLFFVVLLIFSGILSVIYAAVYRLVGPPRYGPLDEPAPKIRAKKYKR